MGTPVDRVSWALPTQSGSSIELDMNTVNRPPEESQAR